MTPRSVEDQWAHWWCNAWGWAHPQWKARFADGYGLSEADCEPLMRSRPGTFLQAVGIPATQPPVPAQNLLQWLALNADQREQALMLARHICFPPLGRHGVAATADGVPEPEINPHALWCRSVAKALRPGVWLDPLNADARVLLGAWVGEACWSRLRLSWAPGEVGEAVGPLPENKLTTLWHAILWRVRTP
jgi:hypothetical protein